MKNDIINIIKEDRLDKSIESQVVFYKGEAFTFFDTGLTRYVFVNKDKTKVIKFLIDSRGHNYNQEEIDIYKNASKETKSEMAETRFNQGVIEQEFCSPIKMDERDLTLKQILFARQCRNEVGWTKDGKLVCFDLDEFKKY